MTSDRPGRACSAVGRVWANRPYAMVNLRRSERSTPSRVREWRRYPAGAPRRSSAISGAATEDTDRRTVEPGRDVLDRVAEEHVVGVVGHVADVGRGHHVREGAEGMVGREGLDRE